MTTEDEKGLREARDRLAGLSLPLGSTREAAQHERDTALAIMDEALAANPAPAGLDEADRYQDRGRVRPQEQRMNEPAQHLRTRYGRWAVGVQPEPDCELCWNFANELPVRSIGAWIDKIGPRRARRLQYVALDGRREEGT